MAPTTPSPASLRALYRALARELPPRPILSSPRSPLHQHLREHFGQPSSSSTSSETSVTSTATAAQAEQYLQYFKAQRTYVELLERYNPGMGMDEEERVRLTARRVGMDLPVEFQAEGGKEGDR